MQCDRAMSEQIILIQPPFPANERHKRVLPLGLAYLAAYLRHTLPDVPVAVIDAHAEDLSLQDAVNRLEGFCANGERTIVGITYWTLQAPAAYELSSRVRQRCPEAVIVHGGVHASTLPEEALRHADYCVMREGEITFFELVSALRDGRGVEGIAGCAWKDGDRAIINPARDFIEQLDSLPFPAWDLLPMERYDTPLHVVGGRRMPVIGSRGCPYSCVYCGSPLMWGSRPRWRSPANVIEEMREIMRRYGITQFHFWDDNLMLDRRYIQGLCEGIIGSGMSVRWTGLTRASHIVHNSDLMPLLKQSGCIGLEIGIESANPETFTEINKNEDLDLIMQVADLHKRNGIYPMFTYMAFNPGETIRGYWDQARFIDRMLQGLPAVPYFQPTPFPIYIGQFCTPHVGTTLSEEAALKGIVIADGWSDRYHHQINFIPNSLLNDVPLRTTKRLKNLHFKLLNYLIQVAFWPDFNRSRSEREQREELWRFRRFAYVFYTLCRGRLRMREIALSAQRKLHLDEKESLRFTAFLAYILAQMGLIRSADDKAGEEICERHIADEDQIPVVLTPWETTWRKRGKA
ncbi:MAG: radical SAM protein [Candidatus Aureabacteria bacterium]|nr:radical SAM protein [Candidatus Auribacterota bacterium]